MKSSNPPSASRIVKLGASNIEGATPLVTSVNVVSEC